MYKGFFKKWNLFLKNFESSDYCDCILYIHNGQGQVTNGSHGEYFAFALYNYAQHENKLKPITKP
jgi:hypothetical protein